MVSCSGSLVQSRCEERGALHTNVTGVCGGHSKCSGHTGFAPLTGVSGQMMGCFSGCLMSSASNQKSFCGVCSAFKCSFDAFVREKVVFPSYSSPILAPPPEGTTLMVESKEELKSLLMKVKEES